MYNKVYVEITNICNMSCSFCHGHKRAFRMMSEAEFITVLEKLKGYTEYIYYHLMGEPLTHPKLCEFIRISTARGFKSIVTTNGTLIRQRGDELISAGVHKVNLSLHSFEQGSEEKHRDYVLSLAEFAKKAADAGVITVFRLWNKGVDGVKNDEAISLLREYISNEFEEHPRGIKLAERIYLEWGERFEWPDRDAEIKGKRFFCYGLKDQFGILSDGSVVPCCLDSDGVITLGNIFEQDLGEILNSERAKSIVEGFKCGIASEELCKRCGFAQRFV